MMRLSKLLGLRYEIRKLDYLIALFKLLYAHFDREARPGANS